MYSLHAIVSCGSPQANRAQKRVEVGDDALVESIECVALLVGERIQLVRHDLARSARRSLRHVS